MALNIRVEAGPRQPIDVRLVGGGTTPGGDGAATGGVGLPFDFKAYKGVVTVGTDPRLHDPAPGVQIDQDVTWASQWGRVVDISFRFTGAEPLDQELPGLA